MGAAKADRWDPLTHPLSGSEGCSCPSPQGSLLYLGFDPVFPDAVFPLECLCSAYALGK